MIDVGEVTTWLQETATERGINDFKATYVRTDGNWLYFAVRLGSSKDASERARILQELEDVWEEHVPPSQQHLLLIPSSG